MKTFCLQKVARTCGRDLRNGDAGQCQSAPRRDTNAPDMERGADPLAEFLLNPCLSPLRLHIQVQANQGNRNERKKCPKNGYPNSAEVAHAETLRRPSLKKRSKPKFRFSVRE